MILIFEESKHIASYLYRSVMPQEKRSGIHYEVVSSTYHYGAKVKAHWNKEHGILLVDIWVDVDNSDAFLNLFDCQKILEFQQTHAVAVRRVIQLFDDYCSSYATEITSDERSDEEIIEEYKSLLTKEDGK